MGGRKAPADCRSYRIVTKNPRMLETLQLIEQISSLRSTVLIQGESGTGKELIARAIHCSGKRAAKPFVSVPCAALAETLLESELFGYEKGAFTGAGSQTKGKFELADGGTLVLDEIGDIPPKLQADLLRVLQERCFYRVGGNDEVVVDVRIIAATNRNLKAAVREGSFREDLFYRVNVIGIRLPPLRERREDIPLLARYFMERLTREMNRPVEDLSEGAVRLLMAHDWPGNVRELENAIERAIVVCRERLLGEEHFEFLQKRDRSQGWSIPEHMTLKEIEKRAIVTTLERTGGNIKESAAILGIDRSTLYEKIKRYAIPVRRGR
ncbi:MAG: sigma 54-interacting transcriptional regulator [Acidobacteriota bacterium]